MIVILCSVSDRQENDSVLDGLVHFILKAKYQDADYVNAVFHRESRKMELMKKDHTSTPIVPMNGIKNSMRHACVSRLLAMMKAGDQLWVCALSDLADSAEDACSLYFSFLANGIQLSFFDASYLDTELLRLNSDPSADQKLMIRIIIQNYFDNAGGRPSGTEGISSADASSVKKKPHLRADKV